jgi:hypothetical protein
MTPLRLLAPAVLKCLFIYRAKLGLPSPNRRSTTLVECEPARLQITYLGCIAFSVCQQADRLARTLHEVCPPTAERKSWQNVRAS